MSEGETDVIDALNNSVEPPDTGPSVSDSAAAAFDSLRAQDTGEQEHEQDQARADRARDEAGRFARAEAAKTAKPSEANAPLDQTTAAPEEPQMPASWGKDRASLWAGMSPEARAYAVERETQMADGVKPFEGLARYHEAATANGTTLAEVMGRVHHIETTFARDPVQGLHVICDQMGIDPQKLASAVLGRPASEPSKDTPEGKDAEGRPAADPALLQRLDRLEGLHQRNEQARQQEAQRQMAAQVKAFSEDPKNEHFEAVAEEVAAIIRGGRAIGQQITLQQAYDKAVWSVPGVREQLLAKQSAEAEAKRVSDAAKAATAARGASKSLKGSSVGSQPAAQSKSVRDAAADAYDRLAG